MLEYTTTISDDLSLVTIDFITVVDSSAVSITEILNSTNIEFTVNSSTQIQFEVTIDSEYKITALVISDDTYHSSYLLINSRAILCSNRKNRKDVTSLLKVKKLDTTSKLTDCLNRVIIANHRLAKYTRAAEILEITNTNCGEDCQC